MCKELLNSSSSTSYLLTIHYLVLAVRGLADEFGSIVEIEIRQMVLLAGKLASLLMQWHALTSGKDSS